MTPTDDVHREPTIHLVEPIGTRSRHTEEALSRIWIEGGKDVHLTLVRCSVTALEIDGGEGFQLHLIGCAIKSLALRLLRAGDVFVNIRDGEIGEVHLEHC